MNFHDAHEAFLHDHETRRNGARLSRLKEGHEHAEILFLQMVWWPAFGHFHHLHPE